MNKESKYTPDILYSKYMYLIKIQTCIISQSSTIRTTWTIKQDAFIQLHCVVKNMAQDRSHHPDKALTLAGTSCQHPARIIRSLRRHKLYRPIYGILRLEDGYWTTITLRKGHFIIQYVITCRATINIWTNKFITPFKVTLGMQDSQCNKVQTPSKSSQTVEWVTPLLCMI